VHLQRIIGGAISVFMKMQKEEEKKQRKSWFKDLAESVVYVNMINV